MWRKYFDSQQLVPFFTCYLIQNRVGIEYGPSLTRSINWVELHTILIHYAK